MKQIQWFESFRKAKKGGFYYLDVLDSVCESGVQNKERFDCSFNELPELFSCIDASSHLCGLYQYAGKWAFTEKEKNRWNQKEKKLKNFILKSLFNDQTIFFYDSWVKKEEAALRISFVGMWPLIMGIATQEQADYIIEYYLFSSDHFYTQHPFPTIPFSNSSYSGIAWNGGVKNSMVYWLARACNDYGHKSKAVVILEKALDATAMHFQQTGTIWEYYPHNKEKIETFYSGENMPCQEYLGHNPLIAMAFLWESLL